MNEIIELKKMKESAKKKLENLIESPFTHKGVLRTCMIMEEDLKLKAARRILKIEHLPFTDTYKPTCDDLVYVIEHVPELRREATEIFLKYHCNRTHNNCEHPEHYIIIAKLAPEYKYELKNNFKRAFFDLIAYQWLFEDI